MPALPDGQLDAEDVGDVACPTCQGTGKVNVGIGGGVLLVLFIAFFFAKNAYANTLVAKRIQPGKANAAGWWLFIFLASLSTGVVLAAINAPKFMAPLIIGPLTLIGLIALVLMLLSSRK